MCPPLTRDATRPTVHRDARRPTTQINNQARFDLDTITLSANPRRLFWPPRLASNAALLQHPLPRPTMIISIASQSLQHPNDEF